MDTNYGIVDIDLRIIYVFQCIVDTTPMKAYLGSFEFCVLSGIPAQVSTATTWNSICFSKTARDGSPIFLIIDVDDMLLFGGHAKELTIFVW